MTAIPCRQQKCLVHLIRDINDDLWKAPFDKELEAFAVEVQALLVPILEAVDRFGLKAWHLRKFNKEVERFYQRNIIGKGVYAPRQPRHTRKRFERYRDSLFTFLNAGRHPLGEQHGGEGDPTTGRAAEDLGIVLQAGRPVTICCCLPSPRRAAFRRSRS